MSDEEVVSLPDRRRLGGSEHVEHMTLEQIEARIVREPRDSSHNPALRVHLRYEAQERARSQ